MKVSVLGFGWFGTPMGLSLLRDGFTVCGSTRTPEKREKLTSLGLQTELLNYPEMPAPQLLKTDILILNIPPREDHLEWFKTWNMDSNIWTIFISSTSGRDLLLKQEKWIQEHFKEWTILRFAGLVGPNRHPGNFLSGKSDLPGKLWPVNLLHQEDAVGFTNEIIRKKIKNEIIEVLCDEQHSREDFYIESSKLINKPLPHFNPNDFSTKDPISNLRSREIYKFKWPTIFGKSL
jgi:hypothetical protein